MRAGGVSRFWRWTSQTFSLKALAGTALSSGSVKSTFWVHLRRPNEFPLQGVFTDNTRMPEPPQGQSSRSSTTTTGSEAEPELQQLLTEHVHQRFMMIHPKLLSDTVI